MLQMDKHTQEAKQTIDCLVEGARRDMLLLCQRLSGVKKDMCRNRLIDNLFVFSWEEDI